jgi:hypothetical protein
MDLNEETQQKFCFGWSEKYKTFLQHMTPKAMLDCGFIEEIDLKRKYCFAIVRHPVERLISAWRYNTQWQKKYGKLDEFCLALEDEYENRPKLGGHLTSQYEHTHIDGEMVCDVFRFEELPRVVEHLKQRFKLPPLPHLNKRQSIKLNLSKESLDSIAGIYYNDFETFYPEFL